MTDITSTERWRRSVAKGRQLAARERKLNWEVGDLLVNTFPMPAGRLRRERNTGGIELGLIPRWLGETGLDMSAAYAFTVYSTAKAWPKGQRKDAAFSAHRILRGHPKRFQLLKDGMSLRDAEVLGGHATSPANGRGTFPHIIEYVTAAERFLRLARQALSQRNALPAEQAERLGAKIAALESEFDVLLQAAGMTEEEAA